MFGVMKESKDCWTPVFARSTKKAMAASKGPAKLSSGLIKAAYSGTLGQPTSASTIRTLDPDDFPALPTRPSEGNGKTDHFRCWRKKPDERLNVVNSSSESFTKDAMYPCLVATVNAVLEKEDAIPKHVQKANGCENHSVEEWAVEVVPGLSFTQTSEDENEGADFLERNARRLFLGGSLQKRNRSRYAFCW